MAKKMLATVLITVSTVLLSAGAAQAHDLGLGAWFGGSLMGAVGVNGS